MSTIRQGLLAEQTSAIRQGLLAGLVAGLLVAVFLFIDTGPATGLHRVASWLSLDNEATGHFVGFLLMLILGPLFGLLFSLITRNWQPDLGRWLLAGLGVGALWWIIFVLGIGVGLSGVSLTFPTFLSSIVHLLVYGLLLSSFLFQWRQRQT